MRRALGFADADFVVGRIGRVDPQKDFPTFIAAARMAAARQPSMRVLLVGEGTDEFELPTELQPVTQALGVRRDMPRLMRALDILVSSSAYGEGLPNVVAEAMASGVPVSSPTSVTAPCSSATTAWWCRHAIRRRWRAASKR